MNKRIKMIVILLGAFFFLANLSYAEIFNIKYISTKTDNLTTRDKAGGNHLWDAKVKVEKFTHQGKPMLYIVETGSGIWGKDKKYKTWKSESYYNVDGARIIPTQGKLIFKDQSGKVVGTFDKYFDAKEKKVICTLNGKNIRFKFADDLVDRDLLGTALANYPFEEKRDFIFHLLTIEPTLYKITTKYRGQESVKIGDKTIDCYKIEIIPDLGALNIFGAFVPKTYFWYNVAKPHDFVKYEGLESGLGTPYVVMEAGY